MKTFLITHTPLQHQCPVFRWCSFNFVYQYKYSKGELCVSLCDSFQQTERYYFRCVLIYSHFSDASGAIDGFSVVSGSKTNMCKSTVPSQEGSNEPVISLVAVLTTTVERSC